MWPQNISRTVIIIKCHLVDQCVGVVRTSVRNDFILSIIYGQLKVLFFRHGRFQGSPLCKNKE